MMETLAHLCQLLKIENCGVKYCDKSKVQPTFRIEDVCGDPRRESQILEFAGEKEERRKSLGVIPLIICLKKPVRQTEFIEF